MARLRIAAPAAQDIARILEWSSEHHGTAGRLRYEALIACALRDIASDPERRGSRLAIELGGERRIYHLRQSRDRAAGPHGRVRSPRHMLVYRSGPDDLVVILRVLHDAMDVARHLPGRRAEDSEIA